MDESRKTCCTCKVDKPRSEFNVRRAARDGLQSRCRTCARQWYERNGEEHRRNVAERNRQVRERNGALLVAYLLEHPCVDCGETDLRVLDFDHRSPSTKRAAVGQLAAYAVSWANVLAEIEKCDVRCANCHRRRTAADGAWRRQSAELDRRAAEADAASQRLAALVTATATATATAGPPSEPGVVRVHLPEGPMPSGLGHPGRRCPPLPPTPS